MYNKVALKENLSLIDYFNLFEDWNVDRGADGEENGFDLLNYVDFHYFATRYGVKKALECQKVRRFWIGGNNFTTPLKFPTTIEDAKKLIENCVEEERVILYPDIYGKYYTYFDRYHPNNKAKHEMEYPVVLQWFTAFLFPILTKFVWIDDTSEYNTSEYDIMDNISNMAYDFHNLYKKTEWATTFMDYLAHYAYNHIEEYFETCYSENTLNKIKKDIKVCGYWYE